MLFDLGGRREEEAKRLELLIAKALRRELEDLPVIPIAHVPRSGSSPVVLEIAGTVPTFERRDVILSVVDRELRRLRPYYHINDRLGVADPTLAAA